MYSFIAYITGTDAYNLLYYNNDQKILYNIVDLCVLLRVKYSNLLHWIYIKLNISYGLWIY